MRTLSLCCRYTIGLFIFIIGIVAIANMSFTGEITYPTNSFSDGTTLYASDLNDKFNKIKDVVNNNNNLSTLSDLLCSDGQVAEWNETSSIWECVGAAGVAFTTDASPPREPTDVDNIPLTTTNLTIQSLEISAPGPGYIMVSFSAYYRLFHTNNKADYIEVGISDVPNAAIGDLKSRRLHSLDVGFPTGEVFGSVATHQVFEVTTDGSYTYYVLGRSSSTTETESISVSKPATQALFIPNRY